MILFLKLHLFFVGVGEGKRASWLYFQSCRYIGEHFVGSISQLFFLIIAFDLFSEAVYSKIEQPNVALLIG